MNEPPKSTDVPENAPRDGFSLMIGSGAIICLHALAFRLRHSAHSFTNSRITSLAETIQYLADSAANVRLVPDT